MHEPYDDDEDSYDENDSHEYPYDPYQWYYKFDMSPYSPISNWLNDLLSKWIYSADIKDLTDGWEFVSIPGFSAKQFPVNSWYPNTASNKLQYLGSDYQGSPIWKTKYLFVDKIDMNYKLHIQSHAPHFVKQPSYYRGMFDILN